MTPHNLNHWLPTAFGVVALLASAVLLAIVFLAMWQELPEHEHRRTLELQRCNIATPTKPEPLT